MLKLKSVLLGVLSSVLIFIVLVSVVSISSLSFGIFSDGVFLISSLVITSVSSIFGGFVSARSAGERALIYGMVNALILSLINAVLTFTIGSSNLSLLMLRLALITVSALIGSVISICFTSKSPYL